VLRICRLIYSFLWIYIGLRIGTAVIITTMGREKSYNQYISLSTQRFLVRTKNSLIHFLFFFYYWIRYSAMARKFSANEHVEKRLLMKWEKTNPMLIIWSVMIFVPSNINWNNMEIRQWKFVVFWNEEVYWLYYLRMIHEI